MTMRRRVDLRAAVAALCLTAGACAGTTESSATTGKPARTIRREDFAARLTRKPRVVLTAAALDRAFALPNPTQWRSAVNRERPRGGLDVYATAAPAVVAIRTNNGHGSGFFVSSDGLIVTNYHVIREGLEHEATSSFAVVHRGVLGSDGFMQLVPEESRAVLLEVDPLNDLALLRLQGPGAAATPFLKLAAATPRPGQECAILGHPVSGMLWTFRSCQISAAGDFPRDMVGPVFDRLMARGADRADIESFFAQLPPRRILLTSAQSNPGDSGGPVLDRDAAVAGVTWGGPGVTTEDKFSYHVPLEMLRAFLADVPVAPMLLVPDPWDFDSDVWLEDIDGDDKPDALVAGTAGVPDVALLDLDNDTPAALFAPDQIATLVRDRKWNFEFAVDFRGITYYDADNDGRVDTILLSDAGRPVATGRFTLVDGRWRYAPVTGDVMLGDVRLFKDRRLSQRFDDLWTLMTR
jgi:serine protease Do